MPGVRAIPNGRFLFFVVALVCCPVFAAPSTTFPEALVSIWEPRLPCDTGEISDRDARFEITSTQRLNYEEIEDLVSAEMLTDSPRTWRIVTRSNVGPEDLEQPFIYVLQGDRLAVSDGHSARTYSRCK